MLISQTVAAGVLGEMRILVACSLLKNKLEFLFWMRESLSRFGVKKGKEILQSFFFTHVFPALSYL